MPHSRDLFPEDSRHTYYEFLALQSRAFALPGDRPHYAPDRPVEMRHVKLELSFNLEQRRLFGVATLTMSPVVDGVRRVELDAVELDVKSVTLEGGGPLPYHVTDAKLELDLDLGEPRKAGEAFTVVVHYEAAPRRGLYITGPDKGYPHKPYQIWTQGEDEDNRYWFPCLDSPKGRLTSEIVATVPAKWVAVSNGALAAVGEDRAARTRVFHWRQDKPHSNYLITLVAGEFVRTQERVDGVSLEYYVPSQRAADVPRSFGNTGAMLRLFQERTGVPYPWDKYAQCCVQDFIFGGMENTSATTLTDITLHDERAHQDFESEPLVAHELAHMWFGDLLTCRDWAHAWLNEGFATFMEAVWTEHHKGADEFKYEMYGNLRGYLGEDRGHYRRPIVHNVYHAPIDLFDRHLYEKGSLVLRMVRHILGDDLFWKAIRHYARTYQGRNVTTADLQRAIEEATGRNLDWFFDQWVYKGGHPDFKVSYSWDEEKKQAALSVVQTQKPDELTSVYRIPVDVAFVVDGRRETRRVEVTEKEHTFLFTLPGRPQLVQFDPGGAVTKTLEFTKPKDLLLYQLRHDEDSMGRIEAAQGLGKLGSPEAVEALKQAVLTDPFWGVQSQAAQALGTVKTEAARQALLECTGIPHPRARRAVAAALGEFKDEAAAEALVRLLEGDTSYFVAAEAASSLGKTRSKKALDALVKALERESHADVIRSGAFAGMAELKDERAVPVAIEWASYGRPQRAREAAISALGKLGELREPLRDQAVDFLTDLLEDPWLRVRTRAVDALVDLKAEKAIPALDRRAARDLDGRVVRMAREAIARIREGRTPPEQLSKLQEDFTKLEEEDKKLKERLERLEKLLEEKKE